MKFVATEAGFKDGLGGASNSKSPEKYHYILFGGQEDKPHPKNSGIYFEYDDQSNGAVNSVKTVIIDGKTVVFKLRSGKSIEITCNVNTQEWSEFKRGIRAVFPPRAIMSDIRRRTSKTS